jgi:hypothetical protein
MNKFLLFIFLGLICENASAQIRGIFTPVEVDLASAINKEERYSEFDGLNIQKLNIVILEPFGRTIIDTTIRADNIISNIGNSLHSNTKEFVVKNIIIIHENEPFDALRLRESTRLIRQSGIVKDARAEIKQIDENNVEITLILADLWSIRADLQQIKEPTILRLFDVNFLGYAHQIDNTFIYDHTQPGSFQMFGSYTIPYIHHTWTTATLFYSTTIQQTTRGFAVDRPFFSPITKWAGGVSVRSHEENFSEDNVNGSLFNKSKFIEQDYWFGRAFQLLPGESARARSTRIGVAGRVFNRVYTVTPILAAEDSLQLLSNSTFLMGSVSYAYRTYYIDRDIYRFGVTEDVPTGLVVQAMGGVELKGAFTRPYTRMRVAYGNHFNKFGNVSAGIDFGTFFRNSRMEQGAVNYNLSYFSDLFKLGTWGLRQFVYTLASFGINRYPAEFVSLNADNELYGFHSESVFGTKKISINLQPVFYAPYSVLGFRFAPVLLLGFGMLGGNNQPLFRGRVYQSYGAGILVRNESLAFRTFQLSIAVYPFVPDQQGMDFNINPIGAYEMRYQDFFMHRPGVVAYR